MEHRWGERVQVDFPIRIVAHAFSVRDGRLTDLSVSGAYIQGDIEVRLMSRIQVMLTVPPSPKHDAPSIAAYVTRKFKDGIGIEWCEFAPGPVSALLRSVVSRPYAHLRRPLTPASRTISRLSAPLLKHSG